MCAPFLLGVRAALCSPVAARSPESATRGLAGLSSRAPSCRTRFEDLPQDAANLPRARLGIGLAGLSQSDGGSRPPGWAGSRPVDATRRPSAFRGDADRARHAAPAP